MVPIIQHILKKRMNIFIMYNGMIGMHAIMLMIQLVRNTVGDKKVLINNEGSTIKWNYIKELQNIQESKDMHAANKSKKTPINYYENKMNVRLAVQTLIASIYSGLLFCFKTNIRIFQNV